MPGGQARVWGVTRGWAPRATSLRVARDSPATVSDEPHQRGDYTAGWIAHSQVDCLRVGDNSFAIDHRRVGTADCAVQTAARPV